MRSVATALICALSVAACTPASKARSPEGRISIGDDVQPSRVGGYCWASECVEPSGWPSPAKPIVADSPLQAQVELKGCIALQSAEYYLWRVSDDLIELRTDGGDTFYWETTGREGQHGYLRGAPNERLSLSLPLEPGKYLLTVFQWCEEGNDATHGFLFEIAA